MNKIYNYILKYLISENIIDEINYDYYKYRLEILEGKLIHLNIIVINFIFSSRKISFSLYSVMFYLLRITTGGYHLKSKINCFLLSILWYLFINILLIPIYENCNIFIVIFTSSISIIYTYLFAPINHYNIHLDSLEYLHLKTLVHKTLLLEIIIAFVISFIRLSLMKIVFLAMSTNAIFIFISNFFKQEVLVNENN